LSVVAFNPSPPKRNVEWLSWLPFIIGLVALYLPSYYAISQTLWREVDQAHGPIVLMVIVFLAWQKREHLVLKQPTSQESILGWALLLFGLACYVLGLARYSDAGHGLANSGVDGCVIAELWSSGA